jgi:phytoene desaturase
VPTQKAIVIGAGLGGIAAALRLRKKGYAVTLIDKQDKLGGRAYVYHKNGFTFDAGPTVVTAHFLFDELFALFGKKREDYINFVPVYPWYRITFADGSRFDYGGTLEQTLAEIRRVSPEDEQGYLRLLEHTKRIFDVGFTQLGDVPFDSLLSMLKVAPAMVSLGTWRTVWQMASKYIKSDKLRRVFSFQPLLVGGNPYNTTAIYSLIQYLEREWGVHFAMGGTGAIINGLEKLMREEGIEIRLGQEVSTIRVKQGPSDGQSRAIFAARCSEEEAKRWRNRLSHVDGVQVSIMGVSPMVDSVADSATSSAIAMEANHGRDAHDTKQSVARIGDMNATVVVCNGDAPAVYKRLVDAKFRPSWPDKKIDNLKYSMGLFVLYFGTTKQYPDVAHHTIILGEKYKQLLHEMFDLHELEMSDFSIYMHRPTATDPSMAPAGCDCFYALVPVPNLQVGWASPTAGQSPPYYWKTIGNDYRNRVVEYLERTTLPGLRECIVEDFYVTPEHFRDNLNTLHGTGFSIQPTFTQSAYFRFHNKSEDIDGLYFVGAGTHPGAGMPGVLCSAKVLDRIVPDAT